MRKHAFSCIIGAIFLQSNLPIPIDILHGPLDEKCSLQIYSHMYIKLYIQGYLFLYEKKELSLLVGIQNCTEIVWQFLMQLNIVLQQCGPMYLNN